VEDERLLRMLETGSDAAAQTSTERKARVLYVAGTKRNLQLVLIQETSPRAAEQLGVLEVPDVDE
jgi:hypothetical protein